MCVKWGSLTSDLFYVSNGVRQGSILSPHFFNVYVDDLSSQLNKLKVGCVLGESIINHLLYADDIALILPIFRRTQETTNSMQKIWERKQFVV